MLVVSFLLVFKNGAKTRKKSEVNFDQHLELFFLSDERLVMRSGVRKGVVAGSCTLGKRGCDKHGICMAFNLCQIHHPSILCH